MAKKHQRDVSDIENKGISTYANGMSTRDISSPLEDIYGIEASAEMISKITDWVASRGQGISLERLTNKEKALVIDTLRERCRLKELSQSAKAVTAIAAMRSGMTGMQI